MKDFYCDCGQRVFFESDSCLSCLSLLGFDPARLRMVSVAGPADSVLESRDGERFRRCSNAAAYSNCNWLLEAGEAESLCLSCRLHDVIPNLDRADNLQLWTRVEHAKRRLLYSLLKLGLPFTGVDGLRFRIMEDHRRNPAVFETFVATAHLAGTVTINILEADDAARYAVREQMQERYRTVLGHLRHECGHFYFSRLVQTPELLEVCRNRFGDERMDYATAMQTYYDQGPLSDWPKWYVSAYASAHPAEDFAETFAHFLHIDDALETARTGGLGPGQSAEPCDEGGKWLDDWITLAITLNEILRSLGADDPYPFVLTEPVREKLMFVSRLVRRQAEPQAG
jgi:hypothetical protein